MPDNHNEYRVLDEQWDNRTLRWYQSFTVYPLRWIFGSIALIIVIGVVSGLVSNWWGAQRAKLTVGNRVTQQVYGTNNATFNISYFHSQCNRILADNQQVANALSALNGDEAQLKQTTDPIAQQQIGNQVTQDRQDWVGVKGQLSNDAREYNARSADQTANPFKARGLPKRININSVTGTLAGNVNCH